MKARALALLALACSAALAGLAMPSQARAQSFFLPATDSRLRADVLLLADEGVLSLPANAWPVPAADVRDQVHSLDVYSLAEPALQAAALRVRKRLQPVDDLDQPRLRELRVAAGEPGLLRSYDTLARDSVEVQATAGVARGRWGANLSVTAVGSPDDGHELRLDGSDLTVRWGNWLFSANKMDRWWGPGWDGSLILSTNARPMPALSLDRLDSAPLDFPVLRRLGPWRFSAFIGQAERHRPDVDRSLLLGMRFSFRPVQIIELGLSRTAQFCGRGRPCDAEAFWNVLVGNDNAGMRVSPEDEPGNQMAGADIRIVSPFQRLPLAVYGQFIGEDNSSTGIPERYLGQWGVEWWRLMSSGSSFRARFEYSNTSCKFYHPAGNDNCSYRQVIYFAGYRYHGRNIGHSTDADSESVVADFSLVRAGGDTWTLKLRRSLLDRRGGVDPYNPVTRGPGESKSAQIGWTGRVLGQSISLQAGVERNERGAGGPRTRGFGFLQWQTSL